MKAFKCALSIIAIATGARAADFQNGSFELPVLAPGSSLDLPAGSTAMTGWTVGSVGQVTLINGPAPGYIPDRGVNPVDGSQQISFNGSDSPPGGSIFQTFTTIVGQTYAVGFNVGRGGSVLNGRVSVHAQVTADGGAGAVLGSLDAIAPEISPVYFASDLAFIFIATTTNATLTFTDTSTGTAGVDPPPRLLLDHVSVTPVVSPAPGPLTNGSFEWPVLPTGSSVGLPGGLPSPTGWTRGGPGLVSWRNGPAYGVAPVDGFQEIGFNGADAPVGGSISQTFSTTPGQVYQVRFNVGRQGPGAGTMRLHAEVISTAGQVLGSVDAEAPASPGYGPAQGFEFTAVGDAATLTFRDTSTATVAVDVLLDNVIVTPVSQCAPTPDGLVSWWPGEGNPNDILVGTQGTAVGNATFAPGRVGRAFVFDGNGDAVAIGNPAALRLQDFTIEAWVKRASASTISLSQNIGPGGEILCYGRGGYAFGLFDNGQPYLSKVGTNYVSGNAQVADTSFHHVAVTKSGSTVVFYVDGVAFPAPAYNSKFEFTTDAAIGARGDNLDGSFLGSIDEVSVYNRALSASEVASIYNAASAGKCPPAEPRCVQPPSGLVSWWRGEGNAKDTAGASEGSVVGGVAFAGGRVGQAFDFDGTGEVRIDDNPTLNVQTFTLETWVYPTALDGEMEVIVYKEADGPTPSHPDPRQYALAIKGPINFSGQGSIPLGNFAFAILGVNGLPTHEFFGWVNGGGAVPMNQWNHLALTFDGTMARTYINGALARTIPGLSGNVTVTPGPLKIGSRSPNILSIIPQERFNGRIDELSLYDRALSGAEVEGIYRAASAGKCPPPPACVPSPNGLVSWWRAESNAVDQVGGNHGTLNGNATFAPRVVGQAFRFDGDNDSVMIGNPGALRLQDFTIEAWIKRASPTQASLDVVRVGHIFGYGYGGYVFALLDDGRLTLGQVGISGVNSTLSIRDTNWHHVAVSKASDAVAFYVDGVGEAAPKYNPNFYFISSAQIGASQWDGTRPTGSFLGLIDEVSVYNRALVEREIQSIFDADSSGKCAPSVPPGGWQLTTIAGPGGTIIRDPDLASYPNGTMVALTAVPNPGFVFTGWSGDFNAPPTNGIYFKMDTNRTVIASFSSVTTPTAIAHWKFDEGSGSVAHDSAGTYHGTLSPGGAEFVSAGVSGNALTLRKGTNGFVNMGNVLGLAETDYSIVAWISMVPGDTTDAVILSKHAAYSRNGYLLIANSTGALLPDNKAAFIEGGSGVAAYTADETPYSTTSVNDGKWHQIVAVYQAGGVRSIYVDGAPAEDSKPSQPFLQNSVAFLIGGANYEGVPTGRFDGSIDDVQIYNRALTASNVDFLFRNPGQEVPAQDLPPTGWRLDTIAGSGGTIMRDPDLASYTNGTTVAVRAVPNPGFVFAGWSGDVRGTANPITISMNGNKTVRAEFAAIPIGKALAHWTFDESGGSIAHDSAGAYHGALSPRGASFVTNGISGNAISVTKAANGFVDMGNVLGLESGDFSVIAWVKMTAGDTESIAIVSKQRAGYANGYLIAANRSEGPTGGYAAADKAWFYDSDQHGEEVTSTTRVNDDNWHQIVGVYVAGANKYIYVDGAPAEASNASRPIVANPGKFVVGGVDTDGVPGGTFTGLIDEVQIYNYALNSSQVDFLFQNPGKEVPPHDLPSGEWQLTTIAGPGGTIIRDPDLASYTNGTTVAVTAVPNAGFVFAGWSGDVSAPLTNRIYLTMDTNKTVTASFSSVTPLAAAVAHWKFDETTGTVAHDSAGSFDGTLSSTGAAFVAGGVSGNAVNVSWFSNGFVNMGPVLGMGTGDFSIVIWAKMPAGDTTPQTALLSKHEAGYANGYIVGANTSFGYGRDGKAYFYDSASPGQEVNSTSSINDGNWHQVVAVYRAGSNKSIYVDGAPVEGIAPSLPLAGNSAPFIVGGVNRNGAATSAFTGLIDEVQIYNYALGPSDIDFLFQNPSREIPPHDLPPGEWQLTTVAGPGGTITRSPDLAKYTNSATVSVTAVPHAGFVFAGWSGDASGTTNPIAITMNGNKTVTASFRETPARVLAVVNPEARQEGRRITVPIELTSQGEVGGMSFILRYDPAYLKDPELQWSSVVGSALNQVNDETPGQIRATFALPATAVPNSTQPVATVSFRARSVPFTLLTDLTLEILDVSRPTGDPITSGSFAQSGAARILVRRVIGDNNANDRLDVGDATIIQRLLTLLDPVRAWDVTGNDLNLNTSLDSGDAVKVLRAVVELDPQPVLQGASLSPSRSGLAKAGVRKATGSGSVELLPNNLRAQAGELITVQVRLQELQTAISGASFSLEYPTNALRLLNSGSHRTGSLVPANAVAVWNVAPAQNNYTTQSGRVSVAVSSPTTWLTNAGVLAEFTFQVQAGQSDRYCWPIHLGRAEASVNGYEVMALPDRQVCFIGRDPLPPTITVVTNGFSAEGFTFSLQGEPDVTYSIETSSDMQNWTPLYSIQSTGATFNFLDPEAMLFDKRFYRARQQ